MPPFGRLNAAKKAKVNMGALGAPPHSNWPSGVRTDVA